MSDLLALDFMRQALLAALLAGFAAHHLWDRWLHQWTQTRLASQPQRPRAV